jgi:putative ABC transport system permease protein
MTLIVGATAGAYAKAFEIVQMFGPDALLVFSGGDEARAIGMRQKSLTIADVEAVRESFPAASLVVPMTTVPNATVAYRENKSQTLIVGSSSDYSRAWSWPVLQGSDFSDDDVRGLRNRALVGQHVVNELFGAEDPVGKYLFVKGIPVEIVGVLSVRGTSPGGANLDDRIVMPYTTVMRKIQNESMYIAAMRVRITDQKNLEMYAEELRLFLRERHRLQPVDPDDFRIISPKEIIKFLVALTGSLVVFLGITGVISLAVAGFVLANLFLLSVRERTAEIGIRRATGARRRDILVQFLLEALMLTTAGGVLGLILGVVSGEILEPVMKFRLIFSWKAFAAGMILAWIVGVAFGLQPARKAANLKPIEAIRGVA